MNKGPPSYFCSICKKDYLDKDRFRTHIHLKHPTQKYDLVFPPKNKYTELELYELEDRIYAQFGELVQLYNEKQNQSETVEDQQRFAGQANYMSNKIVRTPYEDEIEMKSEIPLNIGKENWKPLLEELKKETIDLMNQLEKQRDDWEFFDPYDTNMNAEDEFSLLDIPKLVKNYKKRNITIHNPQFCIFILWIGRICKLQTWKTLYESIACLLCEFEDYLKEKEESKTVTSWLNFFKEEKEGDLAIKNYILTQNIIQIKQDDLNKILKLYLTWVIHFSILPKGEEDPQKKIEKKIQKKQKQETQKNVNLKVE